MTKIKVIGADIMIENILCVLLTIVTTTYSANNIANQNNEKNCDFSSKKAVISERYLSNLDENKYKLYELENGYAIYFVNGEEETFLEGSYEVNSPFFGYEDKETYYLGPGKYFIQENDELSNILEEPIKTFNERRENVMRTYGAVHEDWGSSSEEEDDELEDYTLIENYQYFKGLETIPTNYLGTCGLVAICILLGYYDTFYNDNFVDNSMAYYARTYEYVNRNHKEEILLGVEENIPFLQTVELDYDSTYVDNEDYPLSKWNSYPGTTQALHDYIFDNYLKYNSIGKYFAWGYPMFPYDVYRTLVKYIENECSELQNDITLKYGSYATLAATKTIIKNQIQDNNPLAVTLLSYSVEGEEDNDGVPHTAVAYGYNSTNNYYVVQMGLSKYLGGATILSESSIYGYCYLNYSGEHIHSKNATCVESSKFAFKKNNI
ncbi:MAG: hypothetical protein LUD22_03075 [Coprobacillus sp.]|nr:hypothetical protein [Coprobacillus sp.]